MALHPTRLEAREEIAEGTMAFHFEKPGGFEFKAGQAIDVVLPRQSGTADDQNARHTFSIVSAPFQDELVIATRMRDSVFKRTLKSLAVGSQVTIDGPSGSLGLHPDPARAAIFIAGGIGITPFVSMLRQAASGALQQRVILLYSNRRPEDAAFLAELQQFAQNNQDFRLVATMTKMHTSSRRWDGETGPISADRETRAVGDLVAPVFYIAGPPAMAEAMRQSLNDAGIDDDDISSEEFYGY